MSQVICLFIGAIVGFMVGFLVYRKNAERLKKNEEDLIDVAGKFKNGG